MDYYVEDKAWYASKTLWVMGIAFVASVITGITGENWFDGDAQVVVLSFVGIVLRMVTNQGLS